MKVKLFVIVVLMGTTGFMADLYAPEDPNQNQNIKEKEIIAQQNERPIERVRINGKKRFELKAKAFEVLDERPKSIELRTMPHSIEHTQQQPK